MAEETRVLTEKRAPHSVEAEMSVLGSMMLDESALLKAIEILREEDFYIKAHRIIFRAIVDLFEEKSSVDILSVKDKLEKDKKLGEIGGPEYLSTLVEAVITPELVTDHASIVLEKSIYRKVIQVANSILMQAYSESQSADDLLDFAEHKILEIGTRRVQSGWVKSSDLITSVFDEIAKTMQSGEGVILGLPTGFKDLDALTTGFQPGDLVILASRPSVGKTTFALNIMRYLSIEKKIPTAIFSLEMTKEQLAFRLLCMQGRVDAQKIRKGYVDRDDAKKLTEAANKLSRAPIYIDDTAAIPILELKAKARRIVKEAGVKLIVIDYLQLIQGPRDVDNRQQEISAISRSLKALAKELDITVLALSQLSRAVEQRHDKRPQLSDLRESGAIEQDADVVLFIHRPELTRRQEEVPEEEKRIAEIIIGKQRNGPIGTVKLVFIKEQLRFENYTPFEGTLYEETSEREELPDDIF